MMDNFAIQETDLSLNTKKLLPQGQLLGVQVNLNYYALEKEALQVKLQTIGVVVDEVTKIM